MKKITSPTLQLGSSSNEYCHSLKNNDTLTRPN
jgi:hypothetical protein